MSLKRRHRRRFKLLSFLLQLYTVMVLNGACRSCSRCARQARTVSIRINARRVLKARQHAGLRVCFVHSVGHVRAPAQLTLRDTDRSARFRSLRLPSLGLPPLVA